MNPRLTRLILLAGLATLPAAGMAQYSAAPATAQPELPHEKLVIVTQDGQRHDFSVEMAISPSQQETGLMWRPTVPGDGGMLFDWGQPRDSTMWMRNTLASLDMVFINPDGTIRHIAENTTPRSLAQIPSGGLVRATLELKAGTVAALNLRVGDKVEQRIFGNG